MDVKKSPISLEYGIAQRIGCVTIEIQPNGVVVSALISIWKHWTKIIFELFLGIFFTIVAIPSNDDYQMLGGSYHRNGMIGRSISVFLAIIFIGHVFYMYFRPRVPTVLQIVSDRFIYSEPKLRGLYVIDCPISEIELLEYEPKSGEDRGVIRLKFVSKEVKQIFSELRDNELKAISEVIIPVWKKSQESKKY